MTRFFFDYRAKDKRVVDYRGDDFRSAQDAFDFAQTVAQCLQNSFSQDWTDWSIEVSNTEGQKIFSLPIHGTEQIAA
jgi:hypothetical protein